MGVNSLPRTVTRHRRGCDLNRGPSAPESSTLNHSATEPPHAMYFAALKWRQFGWQLPRHDERDEWHCNGVKPWTCAGRRCPVGSVQESAAQRAPWRRRRTHRRPSVPLPAQFYPPAPTHCLHIHRTASDGEQAATVQVAMGCTTTSQTPFSSTSSTVLSTSADSLAAHTHTHTTTLHPFHSLFSRTTWVIQYQKGKTSLDIKMRQEMTGFWDNVASAG